jgi:alkylation response protein AidB-like acyl-CoA dehydrogenase
MPTETPEKGGSFLVTDVSPADMFTLEDVTEGQWSAMRTAQDFVRSEIQPHLERLLQQDLPLNRELMLKAGERGLLGADVDKRYGGKELDKIASTLVVAASSEADVFSLTWNAHTGIGTMPVVIFGNDSQKARYLPNLAKGAKIAAYLLTEPEAGSDAMSIQTKAVLSPDGRHYVLNGDKIFISNAGLADILITHAKVDGDKFTTLIVERAYPGITIGPEIKKMGIRGSFTASISFNDVKVPVENVLYQVGRGYEVAFCILDLGRFRLAVGCVEKGKIALGHSVRYAKQRIQFGKPICQFGLVQQKLADMAIKTYISESMVYRTAGLLDKAFSDVDKHAADYGKQMHQSISKFTVEYSISKVFASEALSDIVDEAVQIYGGRGYIEGNPAERMYRDSRINRIFEGTNEINRLLAVRWLLRKAAAGDLPIFYLAQQLKADVPAPAPASASAGADDGPVGYQARLISVAKKICLLVCGAAAAKYRENIENEEEILGYLSDIMIAIFAMESGLLRALKAVAITGEEKSALKLDMVRVYVNDAMRKIDDCATDAITAMENGEARTAQLSVLRKLSRHDPVDTVAARRRIAAAVIDAEKYTC